MKTTMLGVLAAAALMSTGLLGGCDNGVGPGGPPILISATWTNVDNPDHTVTFRTSDEGEISGVLTGREDHPTFGFNTPVGGFWSHGRIEITILRDVDNPPKFVAHFNAPNPTRLEFTSQSAGHPTFILEQN